MDIVSHQDFIPNIPKLLEKLAIPYEADNIEPSLSFLKVIHKQYQVIFPFENINLHLANVLITDKNQCKVDIDPRAIEKKLLEDNRGGYCFELNQYFHYVLRALGYHVTPLMARVRWMMPLNLQSPRSHFINVVSFPSSGDRSECEHYLCDVAFGPPGFVDPLAIHDSAIGILQSTAFDTHRVIPYELSSEEKSRTNFMLDNSSGHFMVQTLIDDGTWQTMYIFHKYEISTYADWYCGNWKVATCPDSIFVKNLFLHKVLNDGKITIFNDGLILRKIDLERGNKNVQVIRKKLNRDEYYETLQKYFQFPVDENFITNLRIPNIDYLVELELNK